MFCALRFAWYSGVFLSVCTPDEVTAIHAELFSLMAAVSPNLTSLCTTSSPLRRSLLTIIVGRSRRAS
eukprot:COSAG02_NODE_3465_length_6695_cov_3.210734_9_plen_68_part_00